MSPAREYSIHTATHKELDFILSLAKDEIWNPGLDDASAFHKTDSNGFMIGKLDGKPISCISAVSYGGNFGFIGFYIVLPEYRRKGYGYEIWQAAMDRLDDHLIGLDGVVD